MTVSVQTTEGIEEVKAAGKMDAHSHRPEGRRRLVRAEVRKERHHGLVIAAGDSAEGERDDSST